MLECYGFMVQKRASIQKPVDVRGFNWMLGSKFRRQITTPIKINLDPEGGQMMPVFKRGILLFSDELLTVLKKNGVNNLDCYETELRNLATNELYTNYKAVNIIGVISVADFTNSEYEAHGSALVDVDFNSLSIDESKTHDLKMFRLAECVSGICVHEKIKNEVEQSGIKFIDWIEPEDWIG